MATSSDKKRTGNFSEPQKALLKEVADKHAILFESKKTAKVVSEKEAAWKKITSQFNAMCCDREATLDQLRDLWVRERKKANGNVKGDTHGPVITAMQKSTLLDIMHEFDVIESQEKTYSVNLQKEKAWKEVTLRFLDVFPDSGATEDFLKGVWKTEKDAAKIIKDTYRREVQATGGGTKPTPPDGDVAVAIDIMGDSYDPIDNCVDDDTYVHTSPLDDFDLEPEEDLNVTAGPSGSCSPSCEAESSPGPSSSKKRKKDIMEVPRVDRDQSKIVSFAHTEHLERLKLLKLQQLAAKLDIHKSMQQLKAGSHEIPKELEELVDAAFSNE